MSTNKQCNIGIYYKLNITLHIIMRIRNICVILIYVYKYIIINNIFISN